MKKNVRKLQLNRETLHFLRFTDVTGGATATVCSRICGVTDGGGGVCTGAHCTGADCN